MYKQKLWAEDKGECFGVGLKKAFLSMVWNSEALNEKTKYLRTQNYIFCLQQNILCAELKVANMENSFDIWAKGLIYLAI